MKALVYHDVGHCALEDRPMPKISKPTDAIVKMVKASICGTELHILKGHVKSCTPGRVLGHEGIGVVHEVGSAVKNFQKGDKVVIANISSCGSCKNCRRGMQGFCADGGWLLGNTIDGVQAEYARIPQADGSLHKCVKGATEEQQVLASDVLPTSFECGVLPGRVHPGNTVAIVGSGPVGLGAIVTAQLYSPGRLIVIDLDKNRLQTAKHLGATDVFVSVNPKGPNTVKEIMALTDGEGADTVIEAAGSPESFKLCQELVAPGGTIASLGVHGCKVDLHLEKLWSHNITLTMRMVDANTTGRLIKMLDEGKFKTDGIITHKFKFHDMVKAYETFGQAAKNNALKMLIEF
ncbi:GroES-like protein [Marasmius fiardii PR-910]|nr:GroES-like protein [Marasmius fiardii PR-910]